MKNTVLLATTLLLLSTLPAAAQNNKYPDPPKATASTKYPMTFTDAQWKSRLTPSQFYILRQAGTERAFSSEMCSLFEPGIYSCLCCGTVLFDASQKFECHLVCDELVMRE